MAMTDLEIEDELDRREAEEQARAERYWADEPWVRRNYFGEERDD